MSVADEPPSIRDGGRGQGVAYLHALADHMSQLAWIANGSGWIYWYNKRWFDYTGTTLDEMAGWGWKSVHHPDHVERVVERISRSFETGEPWEDLFPLKGASGEYRWFLSRALPIRDETGAVTCWFGTNTDVTDQRETEQKLRDSEERFRALADSMPQLVWTAKADGVVDYYSSRIRDFGLMPVQPEQWRWEDMIHADDLQPTIEHWRAASQSRERYSFSHRLKMADGAYRWHLSRAEPVVGKNGELRWFGTATDIDDLKAAHEQRRILIEELTHRVKNTLTLVQSIAVQTFRKSASPEAMMVFSERLNALAAAQDVLTRDNWQAAPLRELLLGVIGNFGAARDQIVISGEYILLSARAAVVVSMATHELCTNAVKYGALSTDGGRVDLTWQAHSETPDQVTICWRERGGPAVTTPTREGFGTRLIKGLAADVHGVVHLVYRRDGLECTISGRLAG
ncbi:MAG: PAS domain-containing protein [Proteobacteria bacterium]|nr:PAS domain-containing protein [Pseudomonadota bacterium]